MQKIVFKVVLPLLLILFTGCHETEQATETDYRNCLQCHQGIKRISGNHRPDCLSCHVNPEKQDMERLATHDEIIRNPSDMIHVRTFCLPCHKKEIEEINASLHATIAGVINQTRYLWGAQDTAVPAIYGLSDALEALPEPDPRIYPDEPRFLVDDFLRRRCLRCHIYTRGAGGRGLYRASGCAACHVIYENDGRYRGDDKAIDKSKNGYPIRHAFTKDIPNKQCLHCHNQNSVGADYEGLFEHDYSSVYRSPMKDGQPAPRLYGIDHHHLAKDIHSERGLWCIDCHTRKDVMGGGNLYSYALEVPKRTCTDCHGGFESRLPDLSMKNISSASGRYTFRSRNHGQSHPLPLFSKQIVAHHVEDHQRVRCSACHAQWSYQDYGLSVIREDRIEPYKWYRLTAQADPYLEKIMVHLLKNPESAFPASKDWLTGKEKRGVWSIGWRFRRWESMPLGLDHTGRYTILRPRHQYLVSYVDRLGNVPLNSVIPLRGDGSGKGWAHMPYVPHTISPFGKRCDDCHTNRMTLGAGVFDEMSMDTALMKPSPPAITPMRLLTQEEQKRLLEPSERWKKERLRALITSGIFLSGVEGIKER